MEDISALDACKAILSGYMGSAEICGEVLATVNRLKAKNPDLLYLCDPVIGNTNCYVKPEVLNFFKTQLQADIITPNQFEAEILSGMKITHIEDLKLVAQYFHNLGIKIVVITGLTLSSTPLAKLNLFVSDGTMHSIIETAEYSFANPVNGTGDLFSSLYLGSYLFNKNPVKALQVAVYYMDKVLLHTLQTNARELRVTAVQYNNASADISPLPICSMI